MTDMSAEEIGKAKKKTEGYHKSVMTVQELYDKLAVFVKEGNGDAMIEVEDCFGRAVRIPKDARVCIDSANEKLFGKWCDIVR